MVRRVLISVTSDVVTDQRVLKVAAEISATGADITIIGRKLPWSLECDGIPWKVTRYRMIFKKGFLFYKFFNIRLLFSLFRSGADLLVSNDLDTLLPNFIVSRIRNIPLVFDAHEYFTGSPELSGRPFVKYVWKMVERMVVPRLKYFITVNDSIASLYEKEYGIKPVVVRNFSANWPGNSSERSELGISKDDILCVIQGTGLNHGRGGMELLDAISDTDGIHLLVIGRGDQIGAMRERILEPGIINRVTFLTVMPWNDMMSYTAMADIGLSLDMKGSVNYENSLPNKIFDYMNAGLAVIATDIKEVSAVVNSTGCGMIISEPDPRLIRDAIIRFRDDR
ncbi:MAG: glycosyltransferase, partial [Bacteroidia bacterium]